MKRTTCYFSGQVQGVGFRYTASNMAQEHDVTGYVRNLPDGRVELVVEGSDDARKDLIWAVRDRMADYIDDVKTTESPATGEYVRFSVRH